MGEKSPREPFIRPSPLHISNFLPVLRALLRAGMACPVRSQDVLTLSLEGARLPACPQTGISLSGNITWNQVVS